MARKRYRHRVAIRRSHVRYQWRTFWLTLWHWSQRLFFVALAVWLGTTAYAFWTSSAWFRVQDVKVDAQASAAFSHRVGVETGQHLFGFSAEMLSARLMKEFPEFSDVKIRRRWDRTVTVSVAKRVPEARVFENDRWLGIDSAGVLFPLREAGSEEKLVALAGVTAGAKAVPVLEFLKALKDAQAPWLLRVMKIKTGAEGEIVFYLDDQTPIFWGSLTRDAEALRRRAERLGRVLENEALAGGAEYVRFVDDNRLAVKPKAKEKIPPGPPFSKGGKLKAPIDGMTRRRLSVAPFLKGGEVR
ncbi:MAG: hypothetical protein HY548_08820 [Elusimicrobia bacterium]|nr:hypothetical protein [Elusimicrobiota bacterium]